MSVFGKGVQKLSYGLNLLAGWLLVGMTALTCADVILRIFRRPILGSYEIVEFMAATTAGFALAYTTLKRGHVAVSILVALFSKRVQNIIYLIVQLFSIGLFELNRDGSWIVEPVSGEEGLVTADIDIEAVRGERQNFDPAGHYFRSDVIGVSVDRTRREAATFTDE